jgi:uncharacterized protein (TIGR02996 family)
VDNDGEDRAFCEKIPGLRLSDLVPWLLGRSVEEAQGLGRTTLLGWLREELETILGAAEGIEAAFRTAIKERPDDRASWNAYSDWLADQERPRAELHLLALGLRECGCEGALLQVGPHCAVRVQQIYSEDEVYEQLFLFDDVWASGNVELADAILDYHRRPNVLDDWDEPPARRESE